MYYVAYFTDGTILVFTAQPNYNNFRPGTHLFEVDAELTVSDISEINAVNGFENLDLLPSRIQELIRPIPRAIS